MKKTFLTFLILTIFLCSQSFAGQTLHSSLSGTELHQPYPKGLDASKPAIPGVGDHYYATDTKRVYQCQVAGSWKQISPIVSIAGGDANKVLQVKSDESGYELTAGNAANKPVILDSSNRLPAVDGSQLTGLSTDSTSTIFSAFGGNGDQGAVTVSSATNFSTIDDANRPGTAQFTTLTINNSQTLTIDTGFAYIGVSDTLTLNGAISADGKGAAGGAAIVGPGGGNVGTTGDFVYLVVTGTTRADRAVSGSGGGGGGSYNQGGGGAGGGSGGAGGAGGGNNSNGSGGTATSATKILSLTGGAGDNSINGYLLNSEVLRYYGGGGGGGGVNGARTGAAGGAGGGIIYIECNTLVTGANGVLTADGLIGGNCSDIDDGNGGGGGGGFILVRAKTVTSAPSAGNVTVTGGTTGTGTGRTTGGTGAAGFKDMVDI